MRPRRLVIEGLRSFRRRVELDFGDRQLIAVVGNTGVGKSSILEAITYALYGGATWTANHGDLMSDTADDMLVELEFDADGSRYRIRRTASETSRPSTAELVNETDGSVIDDVRPVNDAVRKLVGLDRNAFLKTVILPQGRFAELLQADRTDRNKVLKNIFRVDELDLVRQHAKTIRDRVYPQVEGLKQRRAALPEDPQAALAEARARSKEADDKAKHTSRSLRKAQELQDALDTATDDTVRAQDVKSALDELAVAEIQSELDSLIVIEEEMSEAQQLLDDQVQANTTALADLDKRRSEATRDGLDTGTLSSAMTRLEELVESFPQVSTDLKDLSAASEAEGDDKRQLVELASADADTAKAVEDAKAAAAGATREKNRVDKHLATAERLLIALRTAEQEADAAKAAVGTGGKEVAAATTTKDDADIALKTATEEHSAAQERLNDLERAHAAAHAAAEAMPGDPCPICARELPHGFKPPQATGLKAAQSKQKKSEHRLQDAQTQATRADQSLRDTDTALKAAEADLRKRERQVVSSASKLAKHLGIEAINSTASDEDLLSVVRIAATTATATEIESKKQLDQAMERASSSKQSLRSHEQHISAENKRITSARTRLQRTLVRLAGIVAALPQSLRPSILDESDIDAVDLSELKPAPLKRLAAKAKKRLDALATIDAESEDLRNGLDALREEVAALAERRKKDVVEPLASLRDNLLEATQVIKASAKTLGTEPETISLAGKRSTSALRDDLKDVTTRRSTVLEAAAAAEVEAHDRQTDAEKKLGEMLKQAEVKDLQGMTDAKVAAEVASQTVAAEVESAKKGSATAKELEKQLGRGGQLVDDLQQLMNLLTNRTFMGEILAQRSKALLAVASKRLDEMTGERYAFTAEFEILDQLTGQPREAKTLSGGESFLASLALALGMVDLASRSGGRLDALFLDEGFGALDTSNLHSAVDALEATARAGRMVAVISHVKAIAERIEDVMLVVSKPQGSDLAWLDDVGKTSLSAEDAQDALDQLLE